MNAGLPSFDTILHNSAASFMHVRNSINQSINQSLFAQIWID